MEENKIIWEFQQRMKLASDELELLNQTIQKLAEDIQQLNEALGDPSLTPEEHRELEKELLTALNAMDTAQKKIKETMSLLDQMIRLLSEILKALSDTTEKITKKISR